MQSRERYGIPPDMQPFLGRPTSPHVTFGHSQISASTSNVYPLREHMHSFQQALQHPEHIPHAFLQEHHHQRQTQNPHGQPQWHQHASLEQLHYLKAHQQIVHQLRPDSLSPGIPASLAAASTAAPNIFNEFVQGRPPLCQDGIEHHTDRAVEVARWSAEEIAALQKICSELDVQFLDARSKGPLWEEVSRKLHEFGYHRSAKTCKEKYEKIQKESNESFRDGKAGLQDGKNYRFFNKLEVVHGTNDNSNESRESDGGSCGGLAGRSTPDGRGTRDGTDLLDVSAAVPSIPKDRNTCNGLQQDMISSDYSGDHESAPSEDVDEQDSTIRRKRQSSSKIFFEKFTKQIMKQQELLYKKFLDTIDRRDRERMMRDEAYKRQETVRLNKEQELRAQELALAATRDAALIAFLEKTTGSSLQLPPRVTHPTTLPNVSNLQEEKEKDVSENISSKRWPKVEVHALIRLRSGMEPSFQEAGPKAHLWQEISASMACMGFRRSPKRCKEKWENINKYFKKTKDSCRKRPENSKTCPYFYQLDTLYRRGILGASTERSGNHSQNLLENNTENTEDGNGDSLAIMAVRENGLESGQATSSTALKLHSQEIKSLDTDDMLVETSQSQVFADLLNNPASVSSSQMDRVVHGVHDQGNKKIIQVEMFVNDILKMQEQQRQKLVDEYDRMEQAQELRELENPQHHCISLAHDHQSHTNAQDSAALMQALVHTFAGNSSNLTITTQSASMG